ncbi:MAG: hypothetical protein FJX62_15755 [Alphaproteobacteria bacterium]|nr:hypothetical protein [Alphaproteobacteria bacterium]
MDLIEEAKSLATKAIPGPGTPEEAKRVFDAMPMAELASLWCALERIGPRDVTEGSWAATRYFDDLPHEAPERAFDLVLAVLTSETDKSVRMQLNNRLMTTLVYGHGADMIDRIESEARGNAGLRWLLGGSAWWCSDLAVKARLEKLADKETWDADKEARDNPEHEIDFDELTMSQLARVWVEQQSKPDKDRDNNWHNLSSLELELKSEERELALDLVLEILKIETNPMLLAVLAAGLLQDTIEDDTIERVEREAAANEKFRDLLGGVWYSSKSDDVRARLDAIVQGKRW